MKASYFAIFLDFDGVLNSDETPDNLDFSKFAIQELNTLIVKTGAKIVVSSDWRRERTISELQSILEIWGFAGEIIGKTTVWEDSGGWIDLRELECNRVKEIRLYLSEHPEITNWIAIDDMDLPLGSDRLVRTDHRVGLTHKKTKEAIELLGEK